ncbi:cyclic nucleotide-gated cation channel beta-1 [Nephila pilipes]|uniref:Cyclic nucleotide-gated cation channel beta-1 n=1 Tax=Nephila pilipes TaxID=299642 RepID=A0A8X6I9A2_NEPPI|nr:cyclic nucleotide-gated cation channel beta-1 [Nephila pilipes]
MICAIGHFMSTFGQSVHYLSSYFLKHIAITEEALKVRIHPLEPEDLKYLDNFSDPEMSIEEKLQSLQTLSLPEEQRWMEAERSAFIARKIQGIVQAFQYRAEKAKEKLVQPPTPSPSPPFESSSDNDPTSPIRQSRPRLQSLIEEEKSSVSSWSQSISFFCCSIKKKFIPTFPKIIDPQSKLYIIWLFFVMMSYAYNAWSIIFRAVFPYQTPDNIPIFLTFDYISDIIYVLDIALFKVRLQFLHNGFWVEDYKLTKANYFRKREFKLDLLSLLPLDLLYFIYGINPLFRLPRFLKVQTFWEFFNRVDAVTKTPYVIRIIRTLMYMMYLIHLNACAYYAMSTWEGIGSNRWVFQGDGNAYIRCFYFATKTATSIGKNPKPENEIEYIFMTISWLMGVFIFAFLVGQIRDIVATATQSRTQYRQLMDQTVMYMRNLNLPDELQRRVRMWLNHNWEQQKTFNVGKILDTLPRKMKTDVAINVHYKTLVKVQLFKDCDKALLRDLVLQLRPVLFLPGDYICRKGEVGKEMYIVNKGIVEVLGGENGDVVLATLTKGSVFGEISLLGIPGCNRRTADVRSKGFSNLFVLSKDDLWEALKNYPEAQKVLKKKAKNIIKENEARAQAARARQESSATVADLQKQPDEIEKSYTPKLVRTVMQVLPKSCHRIQPQSNNSTKTSFTNAPCMSTSKDSNITGSTGPYKPIPFAIPKSIIRKQKMKRPPSLLNPNPSLKPRSMSDSILRIPVIPQEPLKSDNKTFDFPYIIKKISPTKSDPCSYRQLDSEDSPTINVRQVFAHSAPHQRQPQTLFSEDSEEDLENGKYLNRHEDVQEMVFENRKGMGSDISSETSSTSTQKLTIDNSDDENSQSANCSWISSNSSIPYLGSLFHQDSLNSAASSIKDIHSPPIPTQEPESMSVVYIPKVVKNNNDEKSPSSPCLSNTSSVLYLGGLFHQSSSQSSNSSNKDLPLSPHPQREVEDSETSTNGSSSAGYDNLAFVPSGIFSRRSSIFSNTSG